MWAMKYPQVNPFMGIFPGIKAFVAAVLGGIGNIVGAVIGGFLLGLGEILIVALVPGLSQYRDAFAFVILILVLLFRPTGIMGEPITN
jgi:branched-chain amino acid transport system permease protein